MNIDLSDTQLRDIQGCLLMAITTTEQNHEKQSKQKGVNFDKKSIIKRYLETFDVIAKARGML